MTSFAARLYHSRVLRCGFALVFGVAVVSFLAVKVALMTVENDVPLESAGLQTIAFPETEEDLNALALKALRDDALYAIEPAAGE